MNGKKWTTRDKGLLSTDKTDAELAQIMDRSVESVRKMRYKLLGKKEEGYNRKKDVDAAEWGRYSLYKFKQGIRVGDVVTVFYTIYGYDSPKTYEGKAEVLQLFPAVVRTDKGDYQYKELYRWQKGGDFE